MEFGLTGAQAGVIAGLAYGIPFAIAAMHGERLWLDWQLVRRGRPWRDLTYFVIGALTIEERGAHHKDFVKQYREHLIATGAQGVPSFDEAWEQSRLFVMYGLQALAANMDSWARTASR